MQVRGELMHKACLTVPHAYGLQRGLNNEQKIEDVVRWLVTDLKFLHPNININIRTFFIEAHH